MVEMEKEYILQWSGHAERITEKLRHYVSNQALVDVTLLCQDEKLRVHKLVLAATSEYFEELLEQDLGQEPIILLKDLNFDILKAMVEFMYCGETTIAHCHLQSLLDAAQLFKIKDLESIVNFMMMDDDKTQEKSNTQEEDYNCSSIKSNIISNTDIADDSTCINNLFDDTALKTNNICDDVSSDDEHSHDIRILINNTDSTNELITSESTSQTDSNSDEDDEDDTKLINNHLELSSEVGECLKVYSHKKRTSIDSKTNSMMIEKYPDPSSSPTSPSLSSSSSSSSSNELATNCIDLSCDTKSDTTLPSTLEMQVTDNIWNLGKFINDKNKNINDDLFKISDFSTHRKINELFSINNCNISIKRPPVLRRSVRLNNNDDTINNNNNNINKNNSEINNLKKKVFIKKNFNLKTLKSKRKNKESDENNINLRKPVNNNNNNNNNINNSRSLRSTSKLIKKTNSYNRIVKDDKTKTTSSSSSSSSTSSLSSSSILNKNNETSMPIKLNTIASVDRSLWGDMSDVIEYNENNNNNNNNNNTILNEYASSKEIPFALGLLPLRAALERMQAALDYQPRKTRSSVAPTTKFDTNNTSKRKTNSSSDSDTGSPKKQINTEFIDTCTNIINELSSQQIHHNHHHHHHHHHNNNAIINQNTNILYPPVKQ